MSSPNNIDTDVAKMAKDAKDAKDPAFRNNAGNNFSKPQVVKGTPVDYSRRLDAPAEPRGNFY